MAAGQQVKAGHRSREECDATPTAPERTGCAVASLARRVGFQQQAVLSKSASREGGERALRSSPFTRVGQACPGDRRTRPTFYFPQDSPD